MLAPGVNPNNLTAFGSGGESSNAYMIDGVDTSDPEGGTQWLFANYNWFQEVQVIGLGAPAEYGGFTGVASNSLIRSGGNRFSGLFETLFQNKGMIGDNISDEVLGAEPGPHVRQDGLHDRLDVPGRRPAQARQDVVLHVVPVLPAEDHALRLSAAWRRRAIPGRPIARDLSAIHLQAHVRLGQADQLTGFIEYDSYTVEGAAPPRTWRRKRRPSRPDPRSRGTRNYTKVLSASSVFDVSTPASTATTRASRTTAATRWDGTTSTPTSTR